MPGEKIVEIKKGDRYLLPPFFKFTRTVFPSTDFETWVKLGYWDGMYTPHALISGEKIISNVGATRMEIFINGEKKKGVQIGTVGTLPEERNRGLSRQMMNHVIKKYEQEADVFFLFANETVLDFYPKFGFNRVYESLYRYSVQEGNSGKNLKKLDLAVKKDRHLIECALENRFTLTKKFGCEKYNSITWWHLINVYKNDIYFWKERDLLIIMYAVDNTLKVMDIVSAEPPAPEKLIGEIAGFGNTSSILFHSPPDTFPFPFDRMEKDDGTMFFVRGYFDPVPGFKFPVTAQT